MSLASELQHPQPQPSKGDVSGGSGGSTPGKAWGLWQPVYMGGSRAEETEEGLELKSPTMEDQAGLHQLQQQWLRHPGSFTAGLQGREFRVMLLLQPLPLMMCKVCADSIANYEDEE